MADAYQSLAEEAIVFFEQNSGNNKKVDALLTEPNRHEWQLVTCSRMSPGPVANDETLYRQLHHPVYVDKASGELKPTAFDDVLDKGLSVERPKHCSLEDIVQHGRDRAEHYNATCSDPEKVRSLISLLRLSAEQVRELQIDGEKAIGVFDTALPELPAHADVCMLVAKNRLNNREVRSHLFLKFADQMHNPADLV